jgi:hypothetical protein
MIFTVLVETMHHSVLAYTEQSICIEDFLSTIVKIFLKVVCFKFNFLGLSSPKFDLKQTFRRQNLGHYQL